MRKKSLLTKSDCMNVTRLNRTVRHICHMFDTLFEVPNVFQDYCLLIKSDQIVAVNIFVAFDQKTTKT